MSDHGLGTRISVTANSMFQHENSFTKSFFIVSQNKENHKLRQIKNPLVGPPEIGELFYRPQRPSDVFLALGLVEASVLLS